MALLTLWGEFISMTPPTRPAYAFDVEGHTVVYESMEALQEDQDNIAKGQILIVDESFEHHVENKTRKEYLNRTFKKEHSVLAKCAGCGAELVATEGGYPYWCIVCSHELDERRNRR